ncbi:hypothetical protein PC116_g19917 [Phytophthora cactorum]|uniref:Uncharacterized protein n=1 Tax=Phytophthora cactorum TaxID=29920 RepID=A0A329RXN5_9STRA|nr:hypothetical protein PC111_g18697 [Phytophthora cactorum]KAG2807456.1 hypothetical protein PC112_g17385 [Phytophthora cactorum]KAG2850794.1 hypothetical protein PC113_g16472 [Phytophthora cactorum]KAG2882086.1 hypothetical protein PC114_g21204 [Phytophthora cactorum]KAG2921668.1 hypothetical protein PC115_g9463 [Phytophthora cactorum]
MSAGLYRYCPLKLSSPSYTINRGVLTIDVRPSNNLYYVRPSKASYQPIHVHSQLGDGLADPTLQAGTVYACLRPATFADVLPQGLSALKSC